jgi:hypothetical protein
MEGEYFFADHPPAGPPVTAGPIARNFGQAWRSSKCITSFLPPDTARKFAVNLGVRRLTENRLLTNGL